jgi:uncharacterized membrane protein
VTTAAASFTVLQAVDGIALKRAAAEAIRWTELATNILSFFLAGLTLFVYGLAIALGSVYPRWVGSMACQLFILAGSRGRALGTRRVKHYPPARAPGKEKRATIRIAALAEMLTGWSASTPLC